MNWLDQIYKYIAEKNPFAAKKLKRMLSKIDERHFTIANRFLERYNHYLLSQGLTMEYGVQCYLKLLDDMVLQRKLFLETGHYANTSFDEVEKSIYSNPEVMKYHMHGLLLAQFLWPDQYQRFNFFHEKLCSYKPITHYLEIGGGHGLYTLDAAEQLSADCRIDVVDISESSLTLAKAILNEIQVQFFHADIFDFEPKYKYDFITIGEVIEHLENPEAMMKRLCNLLTDKGTVFLTTPINAPMIDHIYLFNNAGEIRELIHKTGFKIDKEKLAISEDVTAEEADRLKLPVMYAAFLKKQK